MDEDNTLTVEEAAGYLRVDAVTVQRELHRGRLPGNKVGRAWRLSKSQLQDYVRGGDSTLGTLAAGARFHVGDLDGGLRILLRHFVADSRVTAHQRLDLLKRLAVLAEAEKAGSAETARRAAYGPKDPETIEERSGDGIGVLIVNTTGLWNRLVEDFARAIESRRVESFKRGREAGARAAKSKK